MHFNEQRLDGGGLTVGAAVHLHPQPHAALLAPLQRDEADVARHDGAQELVPRHALAVGVALKRLEHIRAWPAG